MAIVYEHLRNDTNQVFYVGIGKTPKRAFSERNRNKYWKNITNKVGYSVNIKINDATYDEAIQIEKYLIAFYGRKDLGRGSLVNMTDGGQGSLGLIPSDETKQKLSEAAKGNTHMLGKTFSDETRQKMSESKKNMSEDTKQKMSESKKNMSEETKQKMSEAKKGKTSPNKGKTCSNETKQKMSASMKGRKQSSEHIANRVIARTGMKYNKSKI